MNILITGACHIGKDEIKKIETEGHNLLFLKDETKELNCDYTWPEYIVCNNIFLSHDISRFVNLKVIQTTSSGLDRIPIDYCNSHRISVCSARGVYSIPIAEFVISGILDIYKEKRTFFKQQKEHRWEKRRSLIELYGKNVLIIGCGSIGVECAKRLNSFGCCVYGIDKKPFDSPFFKSVDSEECLYDSLLLADIVILSLPLTKNTEYLFDSKAFEFMKDHSVLVNVSRGKIVNENDLIFALKSKLQGAVLDVFENEPLDKNSELWELDNVVVTPHNAFESEINDSRLFRVIFENIKAAK